MLSSVPGGLPYPHFGPRGYLVGRMQRWRRPLKQQLSAAATCGCSLPPLLSRRSGSGLFMASAHVQTIPGELLKLLSRHPPDPFGRRLQYRAAVVLPLAVE